MFHLTWYKIMVMNALWSMWVKMWFKWLCVFYVCCKFQLIMHACSTKIHTIKDINTKTLWYYVWVKRSVWLSWNASNDSDCGCQNCKLPLLYNSRFTFIGFWFQCLIIVALETLWWSFTDDLVILFFLLLGCGHCKAMKPEYTDAAKTLKDEQVSYNAS